MSRPGSQATLIRRMHPAPAEVLAMLEDRVHARLDRAGLLADQPGAGAGLDPAVGVGVVDGRSPGVVPVVRPAVRLPGAAAEGRARRRRIDAAPRVVVVYGV